MNPETAKRIAQELIINDHVDLIMGIAYSPEAVAVGLVSTEAKMPVFIVNSTTVNIMKDAPYMSRYGMTSGQLTSPLALYAYTHGMKTMYTIESDYSTGIDAANRLVKPTRRSAARSSATFGRRSSRKTSPLTFSASKMPIRNRTACSRSFRRVRVRRSSCVLGKRWASTRRASPSSVKAGSSAKTIYWRSATRRKPDHVVPLFGDPSVGAQRAFRERLPRRLGSGHPARLRGARRLRYARGDLQSRRVAKGKVDPDRTMQLLRGMTLESPRGPIMIDPKTRDIDQNIYIRRTERKVPHGEHRARNL